MQVHGAASDALGSAAAAVKAELASKAPPPSTATASTLAPLPVLAQALLTAARWLLAAARLSAARTQRLLEDPCLAPYKVRRLGVVQQTPLPRKLLVD